MIIIDFIKYISLLSPGLPRFVAVHPEINGFTCRIRKGFGCITIILENKEIDFIKFI